MSTHQRKIYQSENGDEWWLCDGDGGNLFVLHQANLPSGGNSSKIEISDFLAKGRAGPEYQALRLLIGDLVMKVE
ncbi:hypothetical protein [Bradyrhizobium sp. JYMT SZCCT0428]|uniref:hypothetical protein n=1 Tax=Bradyrhizobium sp. JYMT SZCCT0428 TaxID=2807673 RepID=UPI001BAB8481|nr:hypothetical protein [Bradyrhizobium sp. JYMT SZCCT0428]MBR1153144.1 hypothetical protein [Bradyrhizobium sp. JYMT SZCCT0428]